MTKTEIEVEVRLAARKIAREQGISHARAYSMASRAARRARGLSHGLGADVIPTKPVAIADTSSKILASVNAAGDDPTVAATRDAVSKWSWIIPVGSLLMNLKNKITGSSAADAALVGSGRRR